MMRPLKETREFLLDGKKAECPNCGYTRFWKRPLVVFGEKLDETNYKISGDDKENYICGNCGLVLADFHQRK